MTTKNTKRIIIINLLVYLLVELSVKFNIYTLGLWFFYMIGWPPSSEFFLPFQSVSYQFIHSGFYHLLMNMLSLFYFGSQVEKKIGSNKFLIFYIVCGIVSEFFHFQFSDSPIVGASGSIWGMLILYWYFYKNDFLSIVFFEVRVNTLFTLLLLSEILSVIFILDSNVSHIAHLGGAFAGLCLLLINKFLVKN